MGPQRSVLESCTRESGALRPPALSAYFNYPPINPVINVEKEGKAHAPPVALTPPSGAGEPDTALRAPSCTPGARAPRARGCPSAEKADGRDEGPAL